MESPKYDKGVRRTCGVAHAAGLTAIRRAAPTRVNAELPTVT
jgi:hypothetical protein